MFVHALLRRAALCSVAILMAGPAAASECQEDARMAEAFRQAGARGAFVLLDGRTGGLACHDAARAARGFLPASTYKIPNALIALETGVASVGDFALNWDDKRDPRQSWWPPAWAQSHTLATAMSNSVVWFYQELARRIGARRMQDYVDRFRYGNRNISGGIDQFWLSGELRISALEQVDFLRRFYGGQLDASGRSVQVVKDAIVLEASEAYRLSGKTGWARLGEDDPNQVGWFVGYLERGQEVYFFALNMDMRKPEDGAARLALARQILRQRGLMP